MQFKRFLTVSFMILELVTDQVSGRIYFKCGDNRNKGRQPVPSSCTKYMQCRTRYYKKYYMKRMFCPRGRLFDEINSECLPPNEVHPSSKCAPRTKIIVPIKPIPPIPQIQPQNLEKSSGLRDKGGHKEIETKWVMVPVGPLVHPDTKEAVLHSSYTTKTTTERAEIRSTEYVPSVKGRTIQSRKIPPSGHHRWMTGANYSSHTTTKDFILTPPPNNGEYVLENLAPIEKTTRSSFYSSDMESTSFQNEITDKQEKYSTITDNESVPRGAMNKKHGSNSDDTGGNRNAQKSYRQHQLHQNVEDLLAGQNTDGDSTLTNDVGIDKGPSDHHQNKGGVTTKTGKNKEGSNSMDPDLNVDEERGKGTTSLSSRNNRYLVKKKDDSDLTGKGVAKNKHGSSDSTGMDQVNHIKREQDNSTTSHVQVEDLARQGGETKNGPDSGGLRNGGNRHDSIDQSNNQKHGSLHIMGIDEEKMDASKNPNKYNLNKVDSNNRNKHGGSMGNKHNAGNGSGDSEEQHGKTRKTKEDSTTGLNSDEGMDSIHSKVHNKGGMNTLGQSTGTSKDKHGSMHINGNNGNKVDAEKGNGSTGSTDRREENKRGSIGIVNNSSTVTSGSGSHDGILSTKNKDGSTVRKPEKGDASKEQNGKGATNGQINNGDIGKLASSSKKGKDDNSQLVDIIGPEKPRHHVPTTSLNNNGDVKGRRPSDKNKINQGTIDIHKGSMIGTDSIVPVRNKDIYETSTINSLEVGRQNKIKPNSVGFHTTQFPNHKAVPVRNLSHNVQSLKPTKDQELRTTTDGSKPGNHGWRHIYYKYLNGSSAEESYEPVPDFSTTEKTITGSGRDHKGRLSDSKAESIPKSSEHKNKATISEMHHSNPPPPPIEQYHASDLNKEDSNLPPIIILGQNHQDAYSSSTTGHDNLVSAIKNGGDSILSTGQSNHASEQHKPHYPIVQHHVPGEIRQDSNSPSKPGQYNHTFSENTPKFTTLPPLSTARNHHASGENNHHLNSLSTSRQNTNRNSDPEHVGHANNASDNKRDHNLPPITRNHRDSNYNDRDSLASPRRQSNHASDRYNHDESGFQPRNKYNPDSRSLPAFGQSNTFADNARKHDKYEDGMSRKAQENHDLFPSRSHNTQDMLDFPNSKDVDEAKLRYGNSKSKLSTDDKDDQYQRHVQPPTQTRAKEKRIQPPSMTRKLTRGKQKMRQKLTRDESDEDESSSTEEEDEDYEDLQPIKRTKKITKIKKKKTLQPANPYAHSDSEESLIQKITNNKDMHKLQSLGSLGGGLL